MGMADWNKSIVHLSLWDAWPRAAVPGQRRARNTTLGRLEKEAWRERNGCSFRQADAVCKMLFGAPYWRPDSGAIGASVAP
jgi:hypothetical protein